MNQAELQQILDQHSLWLKDPSTGQRAYLQGANLAWANLADVSLNWVTGNGREIKSLHCSSYTVTYTSEVMAIGCQQHSLADWFAFDDNTISLMAKNALEWWNEWKPKLITLGVFDGVLKQEGNV